MKNLAASVILAISILVSAIIVSSPLNRIADALYGEYENGTFSEIQHIALAIESHEGEMRNIKEDVMLDLQNHLPEMIWNKR